MSLLKNRPLRYLSWFLISLLLLVLLLLTIVSTFLATETGSQWLTRQGIERLSEMEGMSATVGEISGNLLQGLQLREVGFRAAAVDVDARLITAAWNPFSLFSGTFQLSGLELQGLRIVQLPSEPVTGQIPLNPVADFQFSPLPVNINIASVVLDSVIIESGQQRFEIGSLQTGVSLAANRLQLTDLQLAAESGEIAGSVELQLQPDLPLAANLSWRYLETLPLDLAMASGQLQLQGSLTELELDHRLQGPFVIQTLGNVRPFTEQGPRLELQHETANLQLEIAGQALQLQPLSLATRGTMQSMNVQLDGRLLQPYGPFDITADTVLRGNELDIENLTLVSEGGQAELAGQLNWSDELMAAGEFTIEEQRPLDLLTMEVPVSVENLKAAGDFQLQMTDTGPDIDVNLDSSSLVMNDYPLTASGGLALAGDIVSIRELSVSSSANSLALNGSLGDGQASLTFNLEAPQLEQFIPGVEASATGGGTLSGVLSEPVVDLQVTVADLRSQWAQFSSLQIQARGDAADYQVNVQFGPGIVDPQGNAIRLAQSRLDFSGNRQSHDLELQINTDQANANLALRGGFVADESGDWQGRLLEAGVNSDAGNWQLLSPSQISFLGQQLRMQTSCWAYEAIRLCIDLQPGDAGRMIAEGSLSNFPLDEFNDLQDRDPLLALTQVPRLPETVNLEGQSDINLYAEFGGDSGPMLNFSAGSDNALLTVLSNRQDEYGSPTTEEEVIAQQYRWQRLSLQGEFQNDRWDFNARAVLNTEHIQDSDLELAGDLQARVGLGADGQLSGSSTARFEDLGWVAAFLPELSDVSGTLDSALEISGSLEQPQVTGEVRVNEGAFHVERLGVDFSDFKFQLVSNNARQASLEGSVSTTEGFLTFNGSAEGINSADWQVDADIQGDNLQLANLPNLLLDVSPQLQLNANNERVRLTGSLDVPVLDITLRELPASAVDISRDVVIVNYPQDRPELATSFTGGQTAIFDLPLSADVQLNLGEQIRLRGFGLDARLSGNLAIQQSTSGTNLTYGELEVTEGSYGIYGQQLSLRDGKLLFLGNYNNPALDIRAVRQVGDLTVGVLMNGTLKNIQSELFSTPSLPENDILAVLVTGRPFSELQSSDSDAMVGAIASLGIRQSQSLTNQIADRFGLDTVAITNTGNIDSSTLTVGKYLTPDVFIRYGVGLFDNTSKVAVDYLINDRLTLKAESGEYQSIDFTYRVEQ